jgi:hypothetical protein
VKLYIDLQGASGAVYRYKLAEDGDPRTTIAGNFIYVDAAGHVIYAGEANNLHSAGTRWSEAVSRHKATHLYTRLNVSGASRTEEFNDIVATLNPIMNRDS